MKIPAVTTVLLTLSLPAMAVCARVGDYQEESLRDANTIFVATITKAYLDPDYQAKASSRERSDDRSWYTIRYEFNVAILIKGDPATIPYLKTSGIYNDPKSTSNRTFGEQDRFVPGDNILVVAQQPGPAPISWMPECTDSRPWNDQARDLLKRYGVQLVP